MAKNISTGVKIFNVTGGYEGSGKFSNMYTILNNNSGYYNTDYSYTATSPIKLVAFYSASGFIKHGIWIVGYGYYSGDSAIYLGGGSGTNITTSSAASISMICEDNSDYYLIFTLSNSNKTLVYEYVAADLIGMGAYYSFGATYLTIYY